jgi:putative two-component system response regulator
LETCVRDAHHIPGGRREFTGHTEAILFALAQAVEQRDGQTAGHCERMAFISAAIGVALGLNRAHLVALYRGAHLHDVGKVGIPDSILFKPGRLTAEEWVTMRSHTTRGEEICRPLKTLKPMLPIIRHHHERWDGSGYPDGLRGEQIPLLARIVQIADIYDALTNARPYKPAYKPAEALLILRQETENGWRDPQLFHVFLRLHREIIATIDYGSLSDATWMNRGLLNLQTALNCETEAPMGGAPEFQVHAAREYEVT